MPCCADERQPRSPDAPGRRNPAGPSAALAAASAHYLRGEPIDMSALAAELGVGRATLYRWVGSREQPRLGPRGDDRAHLPGRGADVGGRGAERILTVLERFMSAVVTAAPLKAFTEREPRLFIRLATMPGTIEDRATELLTRERRPRSTAAHCASCCPRTLAQAIVRVADSLRTPTTWAGTGRRSTRRWRWCSSCCARARPARRRPAGNLRPAGR